MVWCLTSFGDPDFEKWVEWRNRLSNFCIWCFSLSHPAHRKEIVPCDRVVVIGRVGWVGFLWLVSHTRRRVSSSDTRVVCFCKKKKKKKKIEGRSCPIVADVYPKQFSHFQFFFLVNLQKPERSAGSFSSSAVLRETSSLHRFNVTRATTIRHRRPWMMKQPLISIVTMFFLKVLICV